MARYDCFLLHHCGEDDTGFQTHRLVKKIRTGLAKENVTAFFEEDEVRCKGFSFTKDYSKVLRHSGVLVVLLTKNFLEEANNSEFANAFEMAVNSRNFTVDNTIVVILDPKVKDPKTWKKFIVGDYLGSPKASSLVDMSSPAKVDMNIKDLARRIQKTMY